MVHHSQTHSLHRCDQWNYTTWLCMYTVGKGEVTLTTLIVPILLLAVFYLIMRVDKLENRIKKLTYTLNQITSKMELEEPPVHDEIRQLLQEGNDLAAIKLVRQTLGLSLLEGKQYVDSLKKELD